jgi:hypothetical protein
LRNFRSAESPSKQAQPPSRHRRVGIAAESDGLMIALWGYEPLRHKNYAALEIGRDVINENDSWFIVIQPEETKTNTYLEFQIPEALREQFLNYLNLVRPRMLRIQGCKALWVSTEGRCAVIFSGWSRHNETYSQSSWYSGHAPRCP